jgi:hypothetical protein
MIRFLLAFTSVHGALLASGSLVPTSWWSVHPGWGVLVGLLIAAPASVAWAVLEVFQRLAPRRLLDPRGARTIPLLIAGAFAGVASILLIVAGVMALEAWVSSLVIVTLGPAAAALGILAMLPRRRAHECIRCGYDLTHSGSRCPECGRLGTRGAPSPVPSATPPAIAAR